MSGFTMSDWFGSAVGDSGVPTGSLPKTESLRAHADGGNAGGTRSQSAANVNNADRAILYWQAGVIIAALVVLWAMGALSVSVPN